MNYILGLILWVIALLGACNVLTSGFYVCTLPAIDRTSTVSGMSFHTLLSLSIKVFATTSYPFRSAAQWEITSVTAWLNSKLWALSVDSSMMPLTRVSLSFRGRKQTEEFHLRTVTVLSSVTASGGNITLIDACSRFHWVPCLVTVPLKDTKTYLT